MRIVKVTGGMLPGGDRRLMLFTNDSWRNFPRMPELTPILDQIDGVAEYATNGDMLEVIGTFVDFDETYAPIRDELQACSDIEGEVPAAVENVENLTRIARLVASGRLIVGEVCEL